MWPSQGSTAAPLDTVIPARKIPTHRTCRKDMDAADIPATDDQGRIADFHALRGTSITWCASNKEHPRVTQALARHSSVETTMDHYTDLSLLDTRGAVDRLPVPALAPADRGGAVPKVSPSSVTTLHSTAQGGARASRGGRAVAPCRVLRGSRGSGGSDETLAASGLTGRRPQDVSTAACKSCDSGTRCLCRGSAGLCARRCATSQEESRLYADS